MNPRDNTVIQVPIRDIQVGVRHRKKMGDLEAFAENIRKRNLLEPIVITPDYHLVAGMRRLVACRDKLGWETIPAYILDIPSIAHGELDENTLRKDFTPSERVAIVDALRAYDHGGDRRSNQVRKRDLEPLTVKAAAARVGDTKDDY